MVGLGPVHWGYDLGFDPWPCSIAYPAVLGSFSKYEFFEIPSIPPTPNTLFFQGIMSVFTMENPAFPKIPSKKRAF